MNILVAGHNGYIGSVMVRVLKAAGHDVSGIDTFLYRDGTFGKDDWHGPEIQKDIRDITPEDLTGFDAVVLLAALCNDPIGDLNPDWTFDINHAGSVHLAKSAKAAGVQRLVFASSCSMYGASGGDDFLSEESPLAPITAYAESKVRTENDLRSLAGETFSPVFMRNATVYGVSPRLRADVVLNNLTCWAWTTGKIKIMSDGTPWRPIIHVEDVARSVAAVLAAPRSLTHNEAINIGGDSENYQVRELAEIVRETVPDCTVQFAGQGGPDPRNYRVSFAKLGRLLPDFKLKWNAREGARELYEALKAVNLTLADFEGRKYIRLKQLRHLLDNNFLDGTLRWKNRETA